MDDEWDRSSSRTGSVNIYWRNTVVILFIYLTILYNFQRLIRQIVKIETELKNMVIIKFTFIVFISLLHERAI